MATNEEIQAMKQRLADRKAQRKFDRESDEVLELVHSRKPMSVIEAEAKAMGRKRGFSGEMVTIPTGGRNVLAMLTGSVLNAALRNWLFLLVLGMSIWCAALIM